MSYGKAGELLALARDIAARRGGITMLEIDGRWERGSDVTRRRRTQRVLAEIRALFPDAYEEEVTGEAKVVRLTRNRPADLSAVSPRDLAALERSARSAEDRGDGPEAASLRKLCAVVGMLMPDRLRRRSEADLEAILQGQHLVARPGPRPLHDGAVLIPLGDALLSLKRVTFDYTTERSTRRHVVDGYGLLSGYRTYLLARSVWAARNDPEAGPTLWRLDRMSAVELLDEPSAVPEGFSLPAYAKRSFGVFQRDEEYGEVAWRFAPEAAGNARGFRFHPDQVLEEGEDGSLTVRFKAAGHTEMAWFLYAWGDTVEVLEPPELRDLVHPFRRSDFAALP